MATLDEGVINLQRFIGALVNAHGAVEQLTSHFEEKTRTFTELDGQAAHEGDGLNHHLEEAAGALQTGEQDASTALGDLTQAATEGESSTEEGKDLVGKAASDVEEKARAVVDALEGAHSTLTEQGFTALGHTLETAENELQAEDGHCTEALGALVTAAQGKEAESHTAWDAAQGELEHAATDTEHAASDVEAAATDTEHGFEAAGTEGASQCTALEGELEQIYHALVSGVETQGHDWEQGVQQAAQDAASFLHDGEEHQLVQPATLLHDEALAGLQHEYEALSTVLEASTSLVGEVPPLSEDLVKAESVVADVDEVMNALA